MTIFDQLGHEVQLSKPAKRIVSLVPSLTEFLSDIGLDKEVVGITKFCIKPKAWFENKKRVGGTKKVSFEKVKALKPELVIANKEENDKNDIELLKQICPVYVSDISNFSDAIEAMQDIGQLTGKSKDANEVIERCKRTNHETSGIVKSKTCIYAIWEKPLMISGKDTYINHWLSHIGFKNLADELGARYPELSELELKKLNIDYMFLSSEPFPFKQIHLEKYQKLLPNTKIMLVDGEAFSWYGSRIYKSSEYFKSFVSSLT